MKRRISLMTGSLLLASMAMAQVTTLPVRFGKADGLPYPEPTSEFYSTFNDWTSPKFELDEPISAVRLTVIHNAPYDDYNIEDGGTRGYNFFSLGEFYLYDGLGNPVALTVDNLSTNADHPSSYSMENLVDGAPGTFFATTWDDTALPSPSAGEHYIEIAFPEPLSSFSFKMVKRQNFGGQFPGDFIVTKGGEEADPFPTYKIAKGNAVTSLVSGNSYLIGDGGKVYDGTEYYLSALNAPTKEFPYTKFNGYYPNYGYYDSGNWVDFRIRKTPRIDCVFKVEEVELGCFRLKNYFGKYVKEIWGAGRMVQTEDANQAAILLLDDEGYLLTSTGLYVYMDKASLFAMEEDEETGGNKPRLSFYDVVLDASVAISEMAATIEQAENWLAVYQEKMASYDEEGMLAAVEKALADAKAMTTDNTFQEVKAADEALKQAVLKSTTLLLFMYVDTIGEILLDSEFGTSFGCYPEAWMPVLDNYLLELDEYIYENPFNTVDEWLAYFDNLDKKIAEFYDSKISIIDFPIYIDSKDGLLAQGNSSAAAGFSSWSSPWYSFEEPVSGIRLTILHTANGEEFNSNLGGCIGWPVISIGELILYDGGNMQVPLTVDDLYCPAASTDYSYDKLIDGNTGNFMATVYDGSKKTPLAGENYIEVTFPEPMTTFSFQFYRRSGFNNQIPNQIAVTALGVEADPYPEFEFEMGKKVDAFADGQYFVIGDAGKVFVGGENYLSTAGNVYGEYINTSNLFRIRMTPRLDCAFMAQDAGDGRFYLQSAFGNYIPAATANGICRQVTDVSQAAKLYLDGSGNLMDDNGYCYYISDNSTLQACDTIQQPVNVYDATLTLNGLAPFVASTITVGENALNASSSLSDDALYKSLEAMINSAKEFDDNSLRGDMLKAKTQIPLLAHALLLKGVESCYNTVTDVLANAKIGLEVGMYSIQGANVLAKYQEQLKGVLTGETAATDAQLVAYINDIQNQLDTFNSYIITGYSELPMMISAPDGVKDLGILTYFPNTSMKNKFVYDSPTIILQEPIDGFYLTVVDNDSPTIIPGGWIPFAFVNLSVFDADYNEVELTAENFYSNAPSTAIDGDVAYLCDRNEDGTPNYETKFNSLVSGPDPTTGEHYVYVKFPKPMSTFSFQYTTGENLYAPRVIVIDDKPYHAGEIAVTKQVTSLSELDPSKCYCLYGNKGAVDGSDKPSRYYDNGLTSYSGISPLEKGLFTVQPTDKGTYKLYYFVDSCYLAPTTGAAVMTNSVEEAGEFTIAESQNLEDAFTIRIDADNVKLALQDVKNSLFFYNYTDAGFENDATNGCSDWYIFEADYALPTFVQPILKDVNSLSGVVGVTYFNVKGQRISAPAKGINIVRTVKADGSITVEKVLVP